MATDALNQPSTWHSKPVAEAESHFQVKTDRGLSASEAENRLETYGYNRITGEKRPNALVRFLSQFNNPLIYILMASALVTGLFKGGLIDASIIGAVVLINAIIGYIQESKAEKSIQALSKSLTTTATVLRDGVSKEVDSSMLVPGDVVTLLSGNKVPADLRLFRTKDLQISEAILTGESVPTEKNIQAEIAPDAPLGDRFTMAYAGTLVTYGQGTGIVVATSDQTKVGAISHMLKEVVNLETPLTQKFARFSMIIAYVILVLAVVTFIIGFYRGAPVYQTLLESIALAVAAIPEGLPAAVTITLAIGVSRMAKRKAIIRKLPAVETLGTVTVICSDKTGTLTQNQMTVTNVYTPTSTYSVSGTGYHPSGHIKPDKPDVSTDDASLTATLLCGALCNDSRLVVEKEVYRIEGDPTEGALHVSAAKLPSLAQQLTGYKRIDSIPFESEYQYMAVLTHTRQGTNQIWVKGSVEAILRFCNNRMAPDGGLAPLDKAQIIEQAESFARNGLRVLAFATRTLSANINTVRHTDLQSDFIFTGLQAMIDPPREEVKHAIKKCQHAGIEVKMITGDHLLTASAIAAQLGIGKKLENGLPEAIDGVKLAKLSDQELEQKLKTVSVFARVAPEEKLRIVKLLQKSNEVVAMTGDGVNDAPALKQSNIGIAMGITGTDVSKEAADIVLTDDNFASIYAAVEEGRGVYDNLQKIIMWTLPVNLGIGLIILISIFFGLELPILPVQILWINMTTAGVLGLALAMEPKEESSMNRPPFPLSAPILPFRIAMQTIVIGLVLAVVSFLSFMYETNNGASISQAQTVAVNMVVITSVFYLVNCRSSRFSISKSLLFTNPLLLPAILSMLLLQIMFSYVPLFNTLFRTAAPEWSSWFRSLGIGLAFWIVVEGYKALVTLMHKKP